MSDAPYEFLHIYYLESNKTSFIENLVKFMFMISNGIE